MKDYIMNYLYVIHITTYQKDDNFYMERSAALDLHAHRRLLPQGVELVLAAPVRKYAHKTVPSSSLDKLEGITCVPLRFADGLHNGISAYAHNRHKLREAVASADFVHTGCGGFPFFLSPCYLAFRLGLKMRKKVLFVMDCDLVGKLETDQIRLAANPVKKAVWSLFSILCWRMYTNCLKSASATFLLGRGVTSRYGHYANNQLEIYQPIVGKDMIIPAAELERKLKTIQKDSPLNICFAGRLAPEKGVEVMLEALAEIKDRFRFTLNIYGDGLYQSAYLDLAEKLGLGNIAIFHGNKDWGEELFSELRKNHLLIVPHLTLEMTRNVFDGIASGCTIIASDTKALAGFMNDSHAGSLFKTGDHKALAQVLEQQLNNRDHLITSIVNGITFVRKNNRDSHIQRRLEFLKETLSLPFSTAPTTPGMHLPPL